MTIPVGRHTGRASSVPERIRLAALRTVAAGDSKERLAPRLSMASGRHKARRSRTIRAWRAPELEGPRTPRRRYETWPETIQPSVALGVGDRSRQGVAQRMRAVEQAFREELRREAEAKAEA